MDSFRACEAGRDEARGEDRMSDLNRMKAQALLAADGLDGMILFRPEAFRYATGLAAGVATMWGRAGSAIALVPADAAAPLASRIELLVADRAQLFEEWLPVWHFAERVRSVAPAVGSGVNNVTVLAPGLSTLETCRAFTSQPRKSGSE